MLLVNDNWDRTHGVSETACLPGACFDQHLTTFELIYQFAKGRRMRVPIYKISMEEAALGAVFPGRDSPIPTIRADFLRFASKLVHI
jgi:hypothetical protein